MTPTDTVSDADLVVAARDGDERAWEHIVQRYQPLIDRVVRRHRLARSDADDVSQQVWTSLVEHAHRLRDPRALPGWISTTAAHACLGVLRSRKRTVSVDPISTTGMERLGAASVAARVDDNAGIDDDLLRTERRHAVRHGLSELTDRQQQLLLLLVADPPVPYVEISKRMGLPMGSIGPTRARLLKRLENTVAVRLITTEDEPVAMLAVA